MASDPSDAGVDAAPLTINAPPGPTGTGGSTGTGGPAPAFMISPNDYDALVRTTIGEAGGEPDIGKVAVVHNILNRVASGKYPNTVMGVVTQPGQYESVNTRGAQLAAISTDSPQYQSAARAVDMAISGKAPDPTGNALNFYAPQLQAADGRPPPAWAKGPSVQIGRHVFFNGSGAPASQASAPSTMAASAPVAAGSSAAGASGDLSDDDLDAMLSGRAPGVGAGQGGASGAPARAPAAGSGGAAPSPVPPAPAVRQGGGPAGAGAPGSPPSGVAPVSGGGALSDGDLDAMLSGRGAAAGNGGALSDDDLDAMLSGRTPGAAGAGQGASSGRPGALTIRGGGNAQTPPAGPFGSLNRGAFGSAAAAASAATPQPPPSSPSDTTAATDDADLKARFAAAGAKGRANLAALPEVAGNMLSEAGQGVPLLGAVVNPLAARLASAVNGQSVVDNTATGNAVTGQFEVDHPALAIGSRLAGGAAAMGPLVEAAPWAFGLNKGGTLAGRMLTSGAANALLAAGDSAARGEDPTSGGYVGNALRYAPGFLAPGLGAVASGLTKGIGNALGAVADRGANLLTTQTASGVKGYGSGAVDYLLNKIAADGGTNALGAKLSDLGPEGMIADTGPNVRGQAATLATSPGEAKAVVQDAVSDRHDGRTGRILSDVDGALGPAQNPTPVRRAIEDTASAVTNPLFARAYSAGAPWTPELDALAQRPAIRNALTEAGTAAENRGTPLPTVTLDASGSPVASTAPLAAYEAGQRPAVTAALADALGVDPTAGPLAIGDRLAVQRSAAADPLYRAYRSMPVPMTPELQDVLNRPSTRAAVSLAERKAADQGRSIYVPTPPVETPTVGATSAAAHDLPDPFADLGQGPGTLGPAGTGFSADGSASVGSGTPQRPTGPAPTSLVSFLQRGGGVQDTGGDLRAAGFDRFPGLIREGGMPLDRAREAAAEAGYLGGDTAAAMRDTTPNDLLDRLDAHPSYSVHDDDAVAARQAYADWQASRGGPSARDLAAEQVRSHLLETGVPASSIDSDTLDLAAHFVGRHDLDPGDAWEAATMSEPFPGDLPPEPRAAGAAPAEPARAPMLDLTPEGLDYVKRALDDKVTGALRGSDPRPDDARIYGGLKDELLDAIEAHPDPNVAGAYAAARRAYAGPSREIEALDAGRRAYGDSVTREQVARDFGALGTDGERQQFRQGLFSAAAEKLARKGDGSNFADALAGNQAFRDKLGTVAASPEALGRFGDALDRARQTFTEATRPNVQGLHGALDTLDAKVARGADDGVTAARNALVDHLGQDPSFARGRALQGDFNLLTGALDDGATALRSGPNAIHPEDFAERFAGRTPAGQAAERIAMRNQVDRALGQKPNDLLALRSTLQGDDGWNSRKIGSAFGQDAADGLQRTIGREEAFGATYGKAVAGPKTAEMLKGAEDLEKSAGGGRNWKSVTPTGIVAETGRKALDAGVHALFNNSLEPRDLEVAKMIVARGAPRDEVVAQLDRLEARRAAIRSAVGGAAGAARVGGNLLLSAGAPQVAAAVGQTPAGREADRRMRRAGVGVRSAGNALVPGLIDPPPTNALLGR